MWQKYVFHNYKLSEDYRTYSDDIPYYLKGRPRSIIFHCLERKSKCHKFTVEEIKDREQGIFDIMKGDGRKHTINFNVPECSCKDWANYDIPCKHFFAIFEQYPDWGWSKCPEHFQGSFYLSADTKSVNRFWGNNAANDCNVIETDTNSEQQLH